MSHKIIILSAPSGAGKTTIVKELLKEMNELEFSISATTRKKRNGEVNSRDYYFLTVEEFEKRKNNNEFVEYEEVYQGLYYGTLKSEVQRIWDEGKNAVFDVDVKGGKNIKKQYGNQALLIFIKPPSLEELERRLRKRGTDDEKVIQVRLERAKEELAIGETFEKQVINDQLNKAIEETKNIVKHFIAS